MPKHHEANIRDAKNKLTQEAIVETIISKWNAGSGETDHRQRNYLKLQYGAKTRILRLNDLGLEKLPQSLRDLRDVELLDLSHNKLSELPGWIGELSSLKVIDLSNNQLKTLPSEIGSLPRLLALDLSKNRLDSIPNTLCALPLRVLDVQDNPGLRLPESLLDIRQPKQVLCYYFESQDEKGRPLLECKLLLVGRGKAGKTTLIKQLAGEEPDQNEAETHSIAIRELTLGCTRGQVRARAWDFGGQEILHSTHQFFLIERSLYLLVLEPRKGVAQRDAEYWLKLIEAQGDNSPVIVVKNWSCGQHWKVDEIKLRRKFPFIVDFLPTDALHGDGVDELKQIILQTVEQRMRDVWLPFPKRWRAIKDAIAGMQENFLTYSQYTELCAKFGENDTTA